MIMNKENASSDVHNYASHNIIKTNESPSNLIKMKKTGQAQETQKEMQMQAEQKNREKMILTIKTNPRNPHSWMVFLTHMVKWLNLNPSESGYQELMVLLNKAIGVLPEEELRNDKDYRKIWLIYAKFLMETTSVVERKKIVPKFEGLSAHFVVAWAILEIRKKNVKYAKELLVWGQEIHVKPNDVLQDYLLQQNIDSESIGSSSSILLSSSLPPQPQPHPSSFTSSGRPKKEPLRRRVRQISRLPPSFSALKAPAQRVLSSSESENGKKIVHLSEEEKDNDKETLEENEHENDVENEHEKIEKQDVYEDISSSSNSNSNSSNSSGSVSIRRVPLKAISENVPFQRVPSPPKLRENSSNSSSGSCSQEIDHYASYKSSTTFSLQNQIQNQNQNHNNNNQTFDQLNNWWGGQLVVINGAQYLKLEVIGKGGSCKVYKVLGKNMQIYALKKVTYSGQDKSQFQSYCNEIDLLRKLEKHSVIISLIDYEIDPQKQIIHVVLEYGETDLNRMLMMQGGRFDPHLTRVYWSQMLQAVDAVHDERVVHADLKPANFVLVQGCLKLIDFGIAKQISGDTTNIYRESQIGTVNYISPEALIDHRPSDSQHSIKLGRASDIWSLGCILYQLVYGKPPFHHLNLVKKLRSITDPNYTITYPTISGYNDTIVQDVLKKTLVRNPRERATISELLNHPFLKMDSCTHCICKNIKSN